MVFSNGTNLSLSPSPLFAQEPTFENFLQHSTTKISSVTSNIQAQAFIQKRMRPFVQATRSPQGRGQKHKKQPLPSPLTEQMVALAKEIATWHYTSELEKWINQGTKNIPSSQQNPLQAHLSWLKENSQQTEFDRVSMLGDTYFKLEKMTHVTIEDLPRFDVYVQYLYQTYPFWKTDNHGLLGIAEKEGAQGILQRLQEYWENRELSETVDSSPLIESRKLYAARYLRQHYLPYHEAYLRSALLALQRDSKDHARELWWKLRQWQIDQKQKKGLMRLCGTWQWLIHNHQNHGDHKTIMIYPPPSQYDRMDPKPAKIQVQGDTVYIRWEFPRGIIQEESLLLSEKDRALSGTFVNNMGPNGNITARRVKPCSKN